jgi:capsular polysaccharide biosynthesis protein
MVSWYGVHVFSEWFLNGSSRSNCYLYLPSFYILHTLYFYCKVIIITYLFTLLTYLLTHLLQLNFHSVTAVLTPVQTKQTRINIHKRNNKKTVQTIQNTVNTSTRITKTPTQLSEHPHITNPAHTHPHITKPTHTHTLQNQFKQPQYKTHTKWNVTIKQVPSV